MFHVTPIIDTGSIRGVAVTVAFTSTFAVAAAAGIFGWCFILEGQCRCMIQDFFIVKLG